MNLDRYELTSTFKYPPRLMWVARFLPAVLCILFNILVHRGIIGGAVVGGLEGAALALFIAAIFFSIDITRGVIQRVICYFLGYKISFYPLFIAFLEPTNAADIGQYQHRRDALWIAMTPVSLFLLLGVLLLFKLPELLRSILALVFIVNMLGATYDIYFISWLLRKPRGTMLYTKSIFRLDVFEPLSATL